MKAAGKTLDHISKAPYPKDIERKAHPWASTQKKTSKPICKLAPRIKAWYGSFVTAGDAEIPMDFEIDEANDIAEEIMAAARAAAAVAK